MSCKDFIVNGFKCRVYPFGGGSSELIIHATMGDRYTYVRCLPSELRESKADFISYLNTYNPLIYHDLPNTRHERTGI